MSMPALELRGVGYGYGERRVLEEVDLELAEGSATALIGPNGVGKTTLLRLASGAIAPAAGEVWIGGEPAAGISRRLMARRVALVPQTMEVPFAFTVEEIVEMGRTPYLGWLRGPGLSDRVAVERAMGMADVAGLRGRVMEELSGGERQRVKIAVGLAQEPRVLLLDEPTQNLDIGRQVEVMDLLGELRSRGMTVLASMHDLHLVRGNFGRVMLLGPGRGWRFGGVDEVMRAEVLEEAFDCPPGRHPVLLERGMAR